MTTTGLQINEQYFPQFTFLNSQPKKGYNGNNDFQSMNVKKSRGGQASRGNVSKNFNSQQYAYPSQRTGSNKKTAQNYMKNDTQYMFNNFAKGNGFKAAPEKATRTYLLSTASESDGNGNYSELTGFKIVQSGKTLHDETGEDLDLSFDSSSDFEMNYGMNINSEKFASSVFVMGPNASEISLPSFL